MKEYDRVRLLVEKERYAEEGVHKGMDGWICYDQKCEGTWLVCFDQYGDLPNIATISVKEEDMEVIARLMWRTATDFEAGADDIRAQVAALTAKYPLYE